jgi:hypothetical protein
MNAIDHFIVFVLYSDDVAVDVDHLYVKRIHLVSFSYIVIEDNCSYQVRIQQMTSCIARAIWYRKIDLINLCLDSP